MNVFGNLGFSYALAYYSNVRTIANRTHDKTAISVFQILQRFFTRRRSPQNGSQPTEAQLEKDFHALLHGTKEGELVVKNKRSTVQKGKREVIDEVHNDKRGFKEIESGENI